jgi:hypothetical protein
MRSPSQLNRGPAVLAGVLMLGGYGLFRYWQSR